MLLQASALKFQPPESLPFVPEFLIVLTPHIVETIVTLLKSELSIRQFRGAIAQLGERIVRNDEVVGSIPTSSTTFQQLTTVDCEFTSHYVSIQFTTTLSLSLARSMRSFTMSIVRADARCCDSGTNCA